MGQVKNNEANVYVLQNSPKITLKTKSWSKLVKRLVATGLRASVGNIGHNSSSD